MIYVVTKDKIVETIKETGVFFDDLIDMIDNAEGWGSTLYVNTDKQPIQFKTVPNHFLTEEVQEFLSTQEAWK